MFAIIGAALLLLVVVLVLRWIGICRDAKQTKFMFIILAMFFAPEVVAIWIMYHAVVVMYGWFHTSQGRKDVS